MDMVDIIMDIDIGIEIFKQGNEHYYIGNVDTVTEGYDFIISLHICDVYVCVSKLGLP